MTECNTILTKHVVKRTMERTKSNRRKSERMIVLAIERGRDVNSSNAEIRKYLANKQYGTYIAKEYNGYCYIIEKTDKYQIGITMYPIPKGVRNGTQYDGKTKVKDAKKYAKFHN